VGFVCFENKTENIGVRLRLRFVSERALVFALHGLDCVVLLQLFGVPQPLGQFRVLELLTPSEEFLRINFFRSSLKRAEHGISRLSERRVRWPSQLKTVGLPHSVGHRIASQRQRRH
jgi:hypothetical protein